MKGLLTFTADAHASLTKLPQECSMGHLSSPQFASFLPG